jgi:transcriptional regulator with GAF, ATPase, and Fis domain
MNGNVLSIRDYRDERELVELPLPGAVAQSPQMAQVFSCVRRVAPHFRSVLVTGETGTGKEVVSKALHDMSPAAGRFVTVNCSAVVESLFESELFGHVRGAFTGADRDKIGQCEFADGGTLLLDEIGDMPLSTQAKLLRVLQNQEVQRVGSLTPKKIDLRVVAATNKDLRAAIRAREFRADLYYRLSMVEIHLPPLRDREGDLEVLMTHFLRQWSERYGKKIARVSPQVAAILAHHRWPGNVRELENVIGYACMLAVRDRLEVEDLPDYLTTPEALAVVPKAELAGEDLSLLEKCESWLLRQALDKANWNQVRAARALGTTRDRLRYRIRKYGLARNCA